MTSNWPITANPPRVLFLLRSLNAGGAEMQLIDFLAARTRPAIKPLLVTLYDRGELLERARRIPGLRVITLAKRNRWDLFSIARLWVVARRLRPQLAYGLMPTGHLMATLVGMARSETRIVFGIRGSNNRESGHYDFVAKAIFALGAIASRRADLALCNSRSGRDYYEASGYRPHRWAVLHNGINTERFKPDAAARVAIRRALAMARDAVVVGIVARLDPIKDHPTFLRSAALALKAKPGLRFLCVGGGSEDYATSLKTLSNELGLRSAVVWLGPREDMPAIYNAMDVCVLSSKGGEAFPNVLGEAMACAVPCVTTDVGDAAMLVGDTGIVVRPRDPERLAAAIQAMTERIATTPEAGRACRAAMVNRFGWERFVERTTQALLDLVNPQAMETDGLETQSLIAGR